MRALVDSIAESDDLVPNNKIPTKILRALLKERINVSPGTTKGEMVTLAQMTWGTGVRQADIRKMEIKLKNMS